MGREQDLGAERRSYESLASAFATRTGEQTTTLSINGVAAEATGLVENGMYRLWSSTACFVIFDDSVDADLSDMPLTAEIEYYFTIQDTTRLSAITTGATGTLYITRMG